MTLTGNLASATDPTELSARDVVARIRNGDIKAEDYVRQLLERQRAHKDLNAIITIDEERVVDEARDIDRARARGELLGPLAGLPFVVKDQIDVAGYPTTLGHPLLKRYVAKRHATLVEAMLKAGGIVFAKTNCGPMVGGFPGRGLSASKNNNPYFGPVHNPYDVTRISGGSSGGNGAAIAARICPAGLGEDTGGSIRIPAAFCGIAGLRPSTHTLENAATGTRRKRYSDNGVWPPTGFTDTIGPMARTVADVAFIDAALTRETTPQMSVLGLRLGIPREDYWEALSFDQEVRTTIDLALSRLSEAGAELVEVDLNAVAAIAADVSVLIGRSEQAFIEWLAENVPDVTLEDINSLPRRAKYPILTPEIPANWLDFSSDTTKQILLDKAHQYREVFRVHGITALAFPSQVIPAPLINVHEDLPGQEILVDGEWADELDLLLSNTRWGASLGAPSLSVPAGLASGLPVGLSLQGTPGDDVRILAVGIAVENVLGPLMPPGTPQAG